MNKRLKKKKTLKVIYVSNTVHTPSGHNKKIGKRKRKKFFVLKTSVKPSDIRTMLKCYACTQAANIPTVNVYDYMNNSTSHCTDQKNNKSVVCMDVLKIQGNRNLLLWITEPIL